MYEPDITVITPTYNLVENEKADDFTLLVNLLDKQTYPYVEHLIMDNASTDETVVLLKEYKNSGFLNFYSAPDNGKYDAINKGLMHAKGKYVSILSCDDFYHDVTAIYDIVNLMEAENADFCFFPAYCTDPKDSSVVFLFNPAIHNIFQAMPCSHQAMFFKREALEKLGYFDTKFKIMADYDLMIRLVMNKFKGVMFNGNVLTYKMSENAIKHSVQVEAECSHIYHKNFRNIYPITDEITDRIVKMAEIPKPLLDRLASYFPQDRDLFFQRYQDMYNLRLQNAKIMKEQERNNRR
ncbi:glycosyltransferase [bacterium]|nr:glycosyltransferase [bacterium]